MLKKIEEIIGVLIAFCFLHRIIGIVAAFAAEVNRSKAADGHIGALIDRHKAHHLFAGDIGLECHFSPDPIGALFCYGLLGQFVAKLHLKLCTVKTTLARNTRDVKLALSFWSSLSHKGWRSENKTQFIDPFKLFFQLLIGID